MAGVELRRARAADVEEIREIERAAGTSFRTLEMHAVADDPPPTAVALLGFVDGGRAWVAQLDAAVVGYVLAGVVDGCAHIEQVFVHPHTAHRRIGATLIDTVASWTTGPVITLTTFAEVPWNAPYYVRLGFGVLPDSALGPGLRAIRAAERAGGLDRWPRVAMGRMITPPVGRGRSG